jgi:glycosyltransferase involved in cell wall biosynthesis
MTAPRLALCIPARDAGDHLPRLLDTVRAQTDAFDEVLLYDDASSDATGRIARGFGAVVVRSDINTGPSAGKNVLAAATSCEWLHFHDADEALYPRFVEFARRWTTRHDVDVVLFGTEDCDDGTGRTLGSRRWDDAALREDAVRYCIRETITNCGVYRRAAFLAAGGFDTREETKYNEDQAMHLRLALAGLRFRADDYVADIIYRRANSMSSGHPIECARAHFHVLETAAQRTGSRYARDIGVELWRLAGVCGTYRDWTFVRRCLALAQRIGFRGPAGDDPVFRALARITPFGAIAAREQFVRWFKPQLRSGSPSV